MTFLFNLTSVNIEWTRHVFENIAPNARLNPAIKSQARAVQTAEKIEQNNFEYSFRFLCDNFSCHLPYGNAAMLLKPLSRPKKITLR